MFGCDNMYKYDYEIEYRSYYIQYSSEAKIFSIHNKEYKKLKSAMKHIDFVILRNRKKLNRKKRNAIKMLAREWGRILNED